MRTSVISHAQLQFLATNDSKGKASENAAAVVIILEIGDAFLLEQPDWRVELLSKADPQFRKALSKLREHRKDLIPHYNTVHSQKREKQQRTNKTTGCCPSSK